MQLRMNLKYDPFNLEISAGSQTIVAKGVESGSVKNNKGKRDQRGNAA